MDYISKEEFFKQPEDVQRTFLEYFDHEEMLFLDGVIYFGIFKDEGKHTPLLTEGQLRRFIEDKTKGKIDITYDRVNGYGFLICRPDSYNSTYLAVGADLLHAYWKVATSVAKSI